MLNGIGRFAAAAAVPVLLNLTLIGALLLAAGTALTPVWALAWGVAAAGLLQLLWLLVSTARLGYPLRPGGSGSTTACAGSWPSSCPGSAVPALGS